VYEEYVTDRAGHLDRIADYLGVPRPMVPLGDRLQVMRDDWSDEIIGRFVSDLGRPH
jgi:LPS sulfotransferase NodH